MPGRNVMATTKKTKGRTIRKNRGLSRLRKPEDMSLEDWQVALRREFAGQKFRLKNLGDEPLFSEFEVTNPADQADLPRGDPRRRRWARTTAPAPTSPSTRWAPASTSSSRWPAGPAAGRQERPWPLGYQPPYSRSLPAVRGAAGGGVPAGHGLSRRRCKTLARRFFDAQDRLKPEAFVRFHEFLQKASSNGHEFRCYDDALGFIAQVRDQAAAGRARRRRPFRAASAARRSKKLLKVPLYPYQREGALFAAKAGRCLIADDMGLGKTIQAIAAAEILARTAGVERVLVVSPTSLKHQWKQEIEKFTDRPALVVEGLSARRAELYAGRVVLQDHQLRRDLPRPGGDPPLAARPGHPRRGPADQELEDADRPDASSSSTRSTPSC